MLTMVQKHIHSVTYSTQEVSAPVFNLTSAKVSSVTIGESLAEHPCRGISKWIGCFDLKFKFHNIDYTSTLHTFSLIKSLRRVVFHSLTDVVRLAFFILALLDALTKNGSSAGNGAYKRRFTESSQSSGAKSQKDGQECGGGESLKGFTKDQVEGVKRWELLMFIFMYVYFAGNWTALCHVW